MKMKNPYQNHFSDDYQDQENVMPIEKYGSQQNLNQFEPVSILKQRHDSCEKMYPISRPSGNHSINPYAFETNGGGTLPRKGKQQYYNDYQENDMNLSQMNYGSNKHMYENGNPFASKSSSCITGVQRQTKRVQFANVPPLPNASSVGNLTITEGDFDSHRNRMRNSRKHGRDMSYHADDDPRSSHRHRSHRSSHDHHSYHSSSSSGGHRHSQHRRSSSTSNFNTSTMSHKPRSSCSNSRHGRQTANRSLVANPYADEPYDECEYDDDRTCSTCSSSCSNLTSSTTSTDSESDDDFGIDPLEFDGRFSKQNHLRLSQQSRDFNRSYNMAGSRPSSGLYRNYNIGPKISYVDSLPLARTNPAPSGHNNNNNHNEQKSSKSSSKTSSKPGKSLRKFKKDNCVIS